MRKKGMMEFGRKRKFYGMFILCEVWEIEGRMIRNDGEI